MANCDWCGEQIAIGESPVKGYADELTHRKCQRAAVRAYREDHFSSGEGASIDREPFTDWPNGQGTYD